jgi:hypothetical protein
MCRQLNVPRSSFYAWRAAADTVTPTAVRRRLLAQLIKKTFDDSRGTYGCRRVAAELNRRGYPASVGLVADLMRELGLVACQPCAYKATTIAGGDPVASPDLIEREFIAPAPGQRLVGDITYLRTGEGWLYLATVIDLAYPNGGQLAAGRAHAHQPGHRRARHGRHRRPRATRGDLPQRPGQYTSARRGDGARHSHGTRPS